MYFINFRLIVLVGWLAITSCVSAEETDLLGKLQVGWNEFLDASKRVGGRLELRDGEGSIRSVEHYHTSPENYGGVLVITATGSSGLEKLQSGPATAWISNSRYIASLECRDFPMSAAYSDARVGKWELAELYWKGEDSQGVQENAAKVLRTPNKMLVGAPNKLDEVFFGGQYSVSIGQSKDRSATVRADRIGSMRKTEKKSCEVVLDLDNRYVTKTVRFTNGKNESFENTFDYKTVRGLPIFTSGTFATNGEHSKAMTLLGELEIQTDIPPEVEFTLTHFGLPEPAQPGGTSQPTMLIALLLAGIALIALSFWLSTHRSVDDGIQE